MVEIIELYQRRRKISRETFPARMSTEFTPPAEIAPLIKGFNAREAVTPAIGPAEPRA